MRSRPWLAAVRDLFGKLLASLDPLDAAIVRGRYLAEKPETLTAIGNRFGVTRQAVALRERNAIGAMLGVNDHAAGTGRTSAGNRVRKA